MKIQISFLGKARLDAKTGYRSARYSFQNGTETEAVFLGPEIARIERPEIFYILGTAGSMWDMLLDHYGADTEDENTILELWEQAKNEAVTEELLARFEPILSKKLGVTCCLRVISYAKNEAEQAGLLARLAEWLHKDDELVLDVTHGLRHLPMLMLAASHYLEQVRGVKVKEIYYGALEMTADGKTPVLSLKGMLRILDWVQALAADNSSGNYGVFQELLVASNMAPAVSQSLADAAYFERITNPIKAKEKLTKTQPEIEKLSDPLAALFRHELIARTNWWRNGQRGDWESKLAWRWFNSRDYLRAVIYTQEAMISLNVENAHINSFPDREEAREKLKDNPQAKQLFKLRNALAHGVVSQDQKTNQLLANEQSLRSELEHLMRVLLNPSVPG
jgi:CRISPR-associated Csx2 family protein